MKADPTAGLNEIAQRVQSVILTETYERVASIRMLAHYTSVNALESILRSKELWFSRVQDMNDTSEISGGFAIVATAIAEHGARIFKAVPYAELDIAWQFEARRTLLETDTYALSLCEHGNDEQTDRLVMWRAYGHNGNGLCLVLRKDTLLGQTAKGNFPVHWSPIDYESPTQLDGRVQRRLTQMEEAFRAFPQSVAAVPAKALGMLVAVFAVPLVLGHKHLAFKDEREVRFVRSRLLQSLVPPEGSGYRNVGGQEKQKNVFVLPLRNYPEFGINVGLPELLDHVIVGPSYQQEQMSRHVRELLDVHDLAHVPLRCSEIPYRANR